MMNEKIELKEVYTEVGFKATATTTEDTVPYTVGADAEWLEMLEG